MPSWRPTWNFSSSDYADWELPEEPDAYDADSEELDDNQLSRRIREIKVEADYITPVKSLDLTKASAQIHLRIGQIAREKEQEQEKRLKREQNSQARDSEPSNPLSECSDYSFKPSLKLDKTPPRIDFDKIFGQVSPIAVSLPIYQKTLKLRMRKEKSPDLSQESCVQTQKLSSVRADTFVTSESGIKNKALGILKKRDQRTLIEDPSSSFDKDELIASGNGSDWSQGFDIKLYEIASTVLVNGHMSSNNETEHKSQETSEDPHQTTKTRVSSSSSLYEDELACSDNEIGTTLSPPTIFPFESEQSKDSDLESYWFSGTEAEETLILTEEKEALASLREQIQLSPTEEQCQISAKAVEAPHKSPSDPLCEDFTTLTESKADYSDLVDMIKKNLWSDSDDE